MATSARIANRLTFYTRRYCGLCEEAESALDMALKMVPAERFKVERIDIDDGMANKRKYLRFTNDVPVLHCNGAELMRHRIDVDALVIELKKQLSAYRKT